MGGTRERELPCQGVAFGDDFLRRVERLTLRISAARAREGRGSAALTGGGEEFIGYRPYRRGEDPRRLDWDLFARLDRPYVRVTRREASEQWSIHVDASASMGVGPPGKLQAAAELACALTCIGLRAGAEVRLSIGAGTGAAELVARRMTDLPGLLTFLATRRASGSAGLGPALRARPPAAEAGRVFLVGDLLDLEPSAVSPLVARGREIVCAQILAPVELAPPASGAVEWLDPEGEGRLAAELDARSLGRYERMLEERLETWSRLASSHRFTFGCFASDRPFEDVARSLLVV